MRLVYSLLFITALTLIYNKGIKKYSKVFYCVALSTSFITIVYEIYRLITNTKLHGFIGSLEKAFMKGNISIAFFFIVMFAGALNPKWKITKKFLSIRAEAAILGCIFLLPHVIMYPVRFINKLLIHKPITTLYIVYLIVGLIAFLIMVPLFITSLKKVREKMSYSNWKKVQRWAYPFYFLTYIHIVLSIFNDKKFDLLKLTVYTVLFLLYFLFKVIKVYKLKINKN